MMALNSFLHPWENMLYATMRAFTDNGRRKLIQLCLGICSRMVEREEAHDNIQNSFMHESDAFVMQAQVAKSLEPSKGAFDHVVEAGCC